MMHYTIYTMEGYDEWIETQSHKSRRQVLKRLEKIGSEGYFGHIRDLDEKGDGLKELKFNDGRRIYYIIIPVSNVILLLGGNKNGQEKDIQKARGIISDAQKRAETEGF